MPEPNKSSESLATILDRYMVARNIGAKTLAEQANLDVKEQILNRSNIENWRSGERSKRITKWKQLIGIAVVLRMEVVDIEKIIHISRLKSLDELYQEADKPYKAMIKGLLSQKKLVSNEEVNNEGAVKTVITEPTEKTPGELVSPKLTDDKLPNHNVVIRQHSIDNNYSFFLFLALFLGGVIIEIFWDWYPAKEATDKSCVPQLWQFSCYTQPTEVKVPYNTLFSPHRHGVHGLQIFVPFNSFATLTLCWKQEQEPSFQFLAEGRCWIKNTELYPLFFWYEQSLETGSTDIVYLVNFNKVQGTVYYRYLISYTRIIFPWIMPYINTLLFYLRAFIAITGFIGFSVNIYRKLKIYRVG